MQIKYLIECYSSNVAYEQLKMKKHFSFHRALIFLFPIIIEDYKNDTLEVEMFSILSYNSEERMFLKFLSNLFHRNGP